MRSCRSCPRSEQKDVILIGYAWPEKPIRNDFRLDLLLWLTGGL